MPFIHFRNSCEVIFCEDYPVSWGTDAGILSNQSLPKTGYGRELALLCRENLILCIYLYDFLGIESLGPL